MKTLMLIICVLAVAPLSMARLSKEQKITYHVEVKNWPEALKPIIDKALQILTAPNQCWSYNAQSKVSFAIAYDSTEPCSQFVIFQNDTKIIPFNKNLTDAKYEISYEERKKGPAKKAQLVVKLFKGDGKKLISAASTTLHYKNETADSLKDKIVHWSLK